MKGNFDNNQKNICGYIRRSSGERSCVKLKSAEYESEKFKKLLFLFKID
jgi:hypothetical protein